LCIVDGRAKAGKGGDLGTPEVWELSGSGSGSSERGKVPPDGPDTSGGKIVTARGKKSSTKGEVGTARPFLRDKEELS